VEGRRGEVSPRERLLAALARRPADRFACSTYNCHPFAWGGHVSEPGYAPLLDAVARTGAACLCKISARRTGGAPSEVTEARDGATVVTTARLETPKGPLVRVIRTPPGQPSMCVRHFLHDDADIERYRSLAALPARSGWDVKEALARAREVGESGVAYIDYTDPFHDVCELFDQEDFLLRYATDPGALLELVELRFAQVCRELADLLEALRPSRETFLFYTAGPERATPPLMPPRAFERFVVPYHTRLVELIHSFGHPVALHCHGRVRQVLPHALACGFDVIEPAEPPPQGDIGLEELLRAVEGRAAVLGYVQDQDLYTRDPEDIRRHVREVRRITGGRPGYACSPTCTPFQFPPSPRYVENYVAFLEEGAAE
jgi:hypothetical protein